jgi:hypothetical protein
VRNNIVPAARLVIVGAFALVAVQPVVHSARRFWGLIVKADGSIAGLQAAVRVNPGDYSARMELAEKWLAQGDCNASISEASQAFVLIPTAKAPVALIAHCRRVLRSRLTPLSFRRAH